MDKVQKPSDSECYIPTSKHFRVYNVFIHLDPGDVYSGYGPVTIMILSASPFADYGSLDRRAFSDNWPESNAWTAIDATVRCSKINHYERNMLNEYVHGKVPFHTM
jgi:hypothetical protein